jgi:DhnA family fructose-bisphosphate aldolase class Ia
MVWGYPRDPNLDKAAETALDICADAVQMGANIIKVKPPNAVISLDAATKSYEKSTGPPSPSASPTSCSRTLPASASWLSGGEADRRLSVIAAGGIVGNMNLAIQQNMRVWSMHACEPPGPRTHVSAGDILTLG